ncbi:DNA-binding transcriptional regulator SgrR of sgrS sRNA, contains a MarR-type HTH domain and a solute-binding domain [Bacillus sp. OV194]|nr:DNA-binding transcriptional regulator SgrR of sgrS sRNA, contains a MarR-type HTH domain and a solute-binding domain [Bacillus sp. OV194]
MQLQEHYLTLRQHYRDTGIHLPLSVTLEEISSVLFCSKRNANFLLNKMVDREWVSWSPGRGRGNRSSLAFLIEQNSFLMELAKEKVVKGDLSQAQQLLHNYELDAAYQQEFNVWVQQQLGYHLEQKENIAIDVLRFPFYREIKDIDPAYVNRRTEAHMIQQIFDTLLVYNGTSGKLEPHLCHHWRSDESLMVWTFFLRKGILFHHGKLLTAEDVKYTIERIHDPINGSPHRWMMEKIQSITVVHDYELRIELSEPNGLFDYYFSTERLSIVPRDFELLSNYKREPVGSGPFMVESNDESQLQLIAHMHYFKERPFLDRIEIWVWPDYDGEKMLFVPPGEMKYVPHPIVASEVEAHYKALDHIEKGATYLMFNLKKGGPQSSFLFRKAIEQAVDSQDLIEKLGGKRMLPAAGFLPARSIESQRTHSKSEAKRLLIDTEYKGEPLKLYTYEMRTNELNAEWVKEQLASVGVEIEIVVVPIEELKKAEVMREADLILSGEVLADPVELALLDMYEVGNSFISSLMDEDLREEKDQMIQQVFKATTMNERMQRFYELEDLLKQRHALLFLYHSKQSILHHQSLQGVTLNTLGWADYKDLWIERVKV